MSRGEILTALCLAAAPLAAQEDITPDFATCLSIEVSRFEHGVGPLRKRDLPDRETHIGMPIEVSRCGGIAIWMCDRSGAVVACQKALIAEQNALRDKVLQSLPAPEDVPKGVLGALYERLHHLAHGLSAGPDCGGAEDPWATWCETWEANDRLATAVTGWQVARYLGAAGSAISGGWATEPPLIRPKVRPGADQ